MPKSKKTRRQTVRHARLEEEWVRCIILILFVIASAAGCEFAVIA